VKATVLPETSVDESLANFEAISAKYLEILKNINQQMYDLRSKPNSAKLTALTTERENTISR